MRTRPTLLPSAFALAPLLVGLAVGSARDARADDATGQCIASSEQGLDLRKHQKLLEARRVLATCATTRCPDEIRVTCEQRIGDINRVLPSIVFDVKDAAGNDQPGAKLAIDGVPVATTLSGQATPVDPGPHAFVIEVAGQPSVQRQLVINEGERDRHEKVVVGALAAPVPVSEATVPPVGPAPVLSPAPAAPTEATEGPVTGSTQRTVGLVVGGAGAGALVVGAVFGIVASSKWTSAKADCGTACGPNVPAQQEKSDAQSAATVSTVGFIGGAALAAAGVAIYFTAPSPGRHAMALSIAPSVGQGTRGLLVQGSF
jgi:hypothetical protein